MNKYCENLKIFVMDALASGRWICGFLIGQVYSEHDIIKIDCRGIYYGKKYEEEFKRQIVALFNNGKSLGN